MRRSRGVEENKNECRTSEGYVRRRRRMLN
jgi:hypothetical protein